MPIVQILAGLVIGAVGGLAGALFGVGGGIVMVPAYMKLLNMPFKHAVGTSLAVIIVTSVVATSKNARMGLVDFKVAGIAALGAIVAALYGSELMYKLKDATLTRAFGIFLIIVGLKLALDKSNAAPTVPAPPTESQK